MPLEKRLSEYGIPVWHQNADCGAAVIIDGAHVNPLVFNGKRILAHIFTNNGKIWYTAFYSLYKPVLEHYYDEMLDLTACKSLEEIADRIAEKVKGLESETD